MSLFSDKIYNNPILYNDIMWWKKDDIEFWLSIINKTKAKNILELCCGTGRLAIPLIKSGVNYHGVDISPAFIKYLTSKLEELEYDTEKIICADIKDFNLNQSFDLIFIGFNSLAHLLTNQDAMICFENVQNHMHKDSIFGIDIFVPDPLFLYRDSTDKIDIMNFLDSQNNEELHIMESTDYDSDTEVNHISWEFLNKSNQHRFNYNFDMKMFFPDTLNRLLIDSNYQIDKFYGNYDGGSFNEDSNKQIYLCRKGS